MRIHSALDDIHVLSARDIPGWELHRPHINEFGEKQNISDKDHEAVTNYTDGDNDNVNPWLRGNDPEYLDANNPKDVKHMRKVTKGLDSATSRHRTTEPLTVYRTAPFENVKEGTILRDKGFMSTTTNHAAVAPYVQPGHKLMHLKLPVGTQGLPMSHVMRYSGAPGEVLLPRNTAIRVTKEHPDHFEAEIHHEGKQSAVQPKPGPLSWDDIGELWPHVYGDSEIHGDAAEGADGPGIGQAANYLAHATPDDIDAEDKSVYDLDFHRKMVHPKNIDYSPSGANDYRVKRAKEGYQNNEDHMPPLVLVHRNGVYHVADGHHRAEAAASLNKPVRAYVAHSPLKNQPFEDGEMGPFHGAEPTEEK